MFKKIKRSANDATAPIIKPCYVDVNAIWNKKKSTSFEVLFCVYLTTSTLSKP